MNQHPFSIGPDKVVYFTKSNLLYDSGVYKLGQYPWETSGSQGETISLNSTSTISYFTWASSGYNNYYPWSTTYLGPDIQNGSWTTDSDNWDWAVNNDVYDYNGVLTNNLRVLTSHEFDYVICQRGPSNELWDMATVNGNYGLILFSDDYIHPDTCVERGEDQIYSLQEWNDMEEAGAVFFYLCGYGRRTTNTNKITFEDIGTSGYYLTSSTSEGIPQVDCFCIWDDIDFSCYNCGVNGMNDSMTGYSVRLVYEK